MTTSAISISEGCDLTGKRVLVTGASSGIGRELSRVLVMRGAEVIMACRNAQKTQQVIGEMAESLDDEQIQRLVFEPCDLSSMHSVVEFCRRLKQQVTPFTHLFFNAGVFSVPYQLTPENLEYTYASNYLGHYLMLRLMLNEGLLVDDAHVIATMSEGGYKYPFSRADLGMLTDAGKVGFFKRYLTRFTASPNSKVLVLLMMEYFNQKVNVHGASGIRFNCADPGATLTDNVNQMGVFLKTLAPIYSPLIMHSVERGAANLMWLAVAEEAKTTNGVLLNHRFQSVSLPEKLRDISLASACWETSEQVLENIFNQPIKSLCYLRQVDSKDKSDIQA